ncbi:hypothetical protein A6J80_18445 [Paracoccus yeei]|uniref:TNase-like domain-containing protein n=1 Tax=Paracoccus yeei TaxID=147645 RepID=A0A1V0GW03_9RHOB|nr:thermonuclease family protein [Paracoccus yeei]ARC38075.1 hypothetical protein A6J80_18445 [Paracoccus yeei]
MEFVVGSLFVVVLLVLLRRKFRRAEKASPPWSAPEPTSRPAPSYRRRPPAAQRSDQVVIGSAFVIDGDTVVIDNKSVRLFGIDAPELDHPYGQKAKFALIRLCKGQKIRAEISGVDDHCRLVARCTLRDGRDLSAEMVKQGLALDWAKFSGGCYRHLETSDARKRLWLADARQKGRMDVLEKYAARPRKGGRADIDGPTIYAMRQRSRGRGRGA